MAIVTRPVPEQEVDAHLMAPANGSRRKTRPRAVPWFRRREEG